MDCCSNSILGHTGLSEVPGFIKKHPTEVALFALLTPVIIEVGNAFYRGYHKQIPSLREVKAWIRIHATPVKIAGMTAASVSITALAFSVHYCITHKIFQDVISGLHLQSLEDKTQIPAIIFPAYTLFATAHLASGLYSLRRHRLRAIKHGIGTGFAAGAPIAMLAGRYDIRWHHMSYGLLCMLPPLRALCFFGLMMALDSSLYWYDPHRDKYDFSDIFVKYLGWFLLQITLLTIWQLAAQRIFENRSQPHDQYLPLAQTDDIELDVMEPMFPDPSD